MASHQHYNEILLFEDLLYILLACFHLIKHLEDSIKSIVTSLTPSSKVS